MGKFALGLGLLLASAVMAAQADAAGSSHAMYVTRYEGPRSCTASSCHDGVAKDVAESLHYQQRAVPQFLEGWEAGKLAGMTETY